MEFIHIQHWIFLLERMQFRPESHISEILCSLSNSFSGFFWYGALQHRCWVGYSWDKILSNLIDVVRRNSSDVNIGRMDGELTV
jgi:hypothetical protein